MFEAFLSIPDIAAALSQIIVVRLVVVSTQPAHSDRSGKINSFQVR
ncbi:hypothetical protein GGR34_000050 [Microvirga flocculans]|uniref:Uncharacterized protein n=1 Tax=Microvirga flocculans TaxID=217168 RepID=A0A7W6IBJ2_9HYPH|nr:hypothetical protein [Microvirga flocculans]MBB4038421.1 hypothetical protein [Microvirga flocculans]